MGNNLYSNLVNFYNVNDSNFKEFMASFYRELLANHRYIEVTLSSSCSFLAICFSYNI